MTTPELLALIDSTLEQHEASKVNAQPMRILASEEVAAARLEFMQAFDNGEFEWDEHDMLVPRKADS
jgi:hypothetical protein